MPSKGSGTEYTSVEEVEAEMRSLVGRSADLKEEINAIRDKRRAINEELKPLRDQRRKLVLAMAQPEDSDD